MATRAETQITKPSTVEPGDAPADTTDPNELVSSRVPQPDEDAQRVGTVNSAVKYADAGGQSARRGKDRIEKFEATRPDGSTVTVTHNIDTGESKV